MNPIPQVPLMSENPPMIDKVRYLVRINVSRLRGKVAPEVTKPEVIEERHLAGKLSFKQVVRGKDEVRTRYIRVFDTEEEVQEWTQHLGERLKRNKEKAYVSGSVQAFIGSIKKLKLDNRGGGGTVDGRITPACRIFNEGSITATGGVGLMLSNVNDALDRLHEERMKAYLAFENVIPGQRGTKWKARVWKVDELKTLPVVALTPRGLKVHKTENGAFFHVTSGGNKTYHSHKGTHIEGAKRIHKVKTSRR